MSDDPKPSLVSTLGQHKGKLAVAGTSTTAVVTAIVYFLCDHFDDLSKMASHNKATADGAVPFYVYVPEMQEMRSNLSRVEWELKEWKLAHP